VYRYLLGDYAPYIYRTDNYGATWTRLTDGKNGIPADWPTRVVREDPDREGLLYAGTEFGMFISFDNGAHWQSFQQNLPNVPINDIRLYRKDLIVATQGRAMWIMHDVSPLHQITPKTSASAVAVYAPRDGYRTATGTTFNGPNIDYFLPARPRDPVTLEIADASGTLVQADGTTRHLAQSEYRIEVLERWKSAKSGALYPIKWRVVVPSAAIELQITPAFSDQELITNRSTRVTYWEGAVTVGGSVGKTPIRGAGYVEMTGYAGKLNI
jgi:hypothetical protein